MAQKRKSGKKLRYNRLLLLLIGLAVILGCLALERRLTYPFEYDDLIIQYAEEYEIDPLLVAAVIRTESNFNPQAVSNANAYGLMQMTQETFDWIKAKIAPQEEIAFEDLFQPEVSIRFGVCYLAMCLQRYGGDIATAAAAYHSGWGTVDRLLADSAYSADGTVLLVFPYTQMNHYVNKIQDAYSTYQKLYS